MSPFFYSTLLALPKTCTVLCLYNSFNASIKRWLSKVERTAIRIYSPFRKAFFVPQSFIKILYSFKSNSVNSLEEYLLITSHKK